MSNGRKLIENFASASSMRILSAFLSFAFFLYLSRFGQEFLGQFATLFAFFVFLQQAPLLGLHVVVIRDIAAKSETVGTQARNALAIALPTSFALAVLLGLLGSAIYPPDVHAAFWLVGLAMIPTAFIVVFESVLVGQERMTLMAWGNAAENVIRVASGIGVTLAGGGLREIMVCFLVGRIFLAVFYAFTSGIVEKMSEGPLSASALTSLLRQCPIFFGILALSAGINRIDAILLPSMDGFSEAGIYSAAYRLYEICLMVPSILTFVLFPAFSKYFETSKENFEALARRLFRYCVVVGIPFSILLSFSAPLIIEGIYRPQLHDAGKVLSVLIFLPVIVGLDQILTMCLLAAHQQRLDLTVLFMSCSIYVTLLFALIPRYGAMGAAWATLCTGMAQMLIRYAMVRRFVRVDGLMEELVRPALAASVMALLVGSLQGRSLLLACFAGVVAYAVSTVLVSAVNKDDKEVFARAFKAKERMEAEGTLPA